MQFVDGSLLKLKSYIEVYLEQPVEFTLSLVELESEVIVWKAKLRECKYYMLQLWFVSAENVYNFYQVLPHIYFCYFRSKLPGLELKVSKHHKRDHCCFSG